MSRTMLSTVLLLVTAACAGNQANPATEPTTEYLCRGRGEVAQINARIDATSREEAEAKFKEQHKDVINPTCTPNARR